MVYHQNRVEIEIYVIDGSAQGQETQMPYLDIRGIRSNPPGGMKNTKIQVQTRSSWLNCALRDDEAVYWVSIGHYEAVAVGN